MRIGFVKIIGTTLIISLSTIIIHAQDNGILKTKKFSPKPYIPLQSLVLHSSPKKDSLLLLNIPNTFEFNTLSPFCKLEYFVQKQSNMPIKFRLGSVDYVDKLESK